MKHNNIIIKNASTHNLKNVSLEIPKRKLVVFTGVSGSGKSSLVFDTIYTESQRQLIETFSSFARARMPKLSRPPVEEIKNISTAVVIDQKRMGKTLRSTVGTATDLYTYLRLLFSRCGDKFIGPSFVFGFNHPKGMCLDCKGLGQRVKADVKSLIDYNRTFREGSIKHPDYKVGGWMWREIVAMGIFDPDKKIKNYSKEELEELLYAKAIPVEKKHGAGVYTKNFKGIARRLERYYLKKPVDQMSESRRDAYSKYFIQDTCETCSGTRLNEAARSVRINGKNISELSEMEFWELSEFLGDVYGEIAEPIVKKMQQILANLIKIGVGYLSLNRATSTLSGGESQRIKMARQLNCDLVDMMYIMDEPSIGLHSRDVSKLIEILTDLRNKGNSVFVVEHDAAVIRSADYVIDVGPEAGRLGGEIVYAGESKGLKESHGLTSKCLNRVEKEEYTRRSWKECIEVKDANLHNLKNVSVKIPKGVFTCVTGVAGSGKSSLINDVFVEKHKETVVIDQSPIGRSSRSNPVTYLGIFGLIRKEFAKANNSDAALFSFNSKGACPKCKGLGVVSYEMNFLDEIKVVCDECNGKRYKEDVLKLRYKKNNIFDVLNMTIRETKGFFDNPKIDQSLQVLCDVGLGYLELGQSLSTLSGGECQRIKLASELRKKGNIYVMDEPTTGLHMADVDKLMDIIENLVNNDNTVIVIEHNLDVIKQADWVIDLGPEGGSSGGGILFEGLPEDLVACKKSYTGRYLKEVL